MSQTAVAQPSAIPFLEAASAVDAEAPEVKAQAKQISDQIDAAIAEDKARRKLRKESGDVSLLLLGQSESGKSTLLKQFQLLHAQSTFDDERASWRPVILLNVLNTVRNVLAIIKEERLSPSPELGNQIPTDQESIITLEQRSQELLSCEDKLVQILVNSGHVQSSSSSKNVYMRRRMQRKARMSIDNETGNSGLKQLSQSDQTSLEVISATMGGVQQDIQTFWNLPFIRKLVKERLTEDWRAYFINHLPRITSTSYIPTDDDILHVRIMTMGVVEHTFQVMTPISVISPFKKGGPKYTDMHIFDVGGARGQRHAWASYFDEATAIIFLAPISGFDQYLVEAPDVNRIQDSIELFQKICDNPLLGNVELVLFLNKCDLLDKKLQDGIKIRDYISSYGDQPNTLPRAQKFFSAHFQAVFARSVNKLKTESKRGLHVHFTSVVDTKATRIVLANVQDAILKGSLKDAKLM